jgi:hypothetical protein
MAVEQVIKISLDDLKALGGIDNLKKSLGETEQSTKSLKQQLREATAEVAQMAEKYGETSKETINAAKRAAELKDKIEDANDAILAFKGEGTFLATGKALQSVASGFAAAQGAMGLFGSESESVEKAILKVQSAMALAQGLEGLEDAGRAFTQLKTVAIDAFNGIKAAIGSTGIGALVIALGAIYYYWDDIKEAVSGVSEEQKKLTELAEDQYEVEKKKSGELGNQDNILKLQGKSDKEILAIKIKQQKAEIDKGLTVVKNLEIERKLAIENAKYYRDIFVKLANIGVEISLTSLRILTKPIDLMIKTANAVSEKLGFGKITDFSIDNAIDKVKNWGVQSVADLLFDVNQTELTDKINKYKNDILKTQNDLAGNILSSRATDKTTTKTTKKADGSLSDEQLISLENEKNYAMLQLANFKDSEAAKIDVAKLAEENMTMKAIEQANLRMQIAEIEAQQRKASIMAVADAFGAASEIIGQETAVGKGLAIAQAIMNTYLGVTEALRQKSTLPSPFDVVAKVANVATVIATGLKAVKQITAVKVGSRGGGGGGAPSMGGVSASTPTPQFNVAGDAGVNQIASTLANQQPIKAYVVGKEVSTQQSLDRNIVKNATLG